MFCLPNRANSSSTNPYHGALMICKLTILRNMRVNCIYGRLKELELLSATHEHGADGFYCQHEILF